MSYASWEAQITRNSLQQIVQHYLYQQVIVVRCYLYIFCHVTVHSMHTCIVTVSSSSLHASVHCHSWSILKQLGISWTVFVVIIVITINCWLGTHRSLWYIISVMSVCLLDDKLWKPWCMKCIFLIRYISREYGSSSCVKVIGWSSRSQEPKI